MISYRKLVSPNCGFSNFKKCGLFSSQQIIVQYISTLLSGSRFTSCDIYLDVLFICVALFLSSFNAIDFNIEKEKRNQSIPCIFEQSLQQNLCEPLFFFVQCISVFFQRIPCTKGHFIQMLTIQERTLYTSCRKQTLLLTNFALDSMYSVIL